MGRCHGSEKNLTLPCEYSVSFNQFLFRKYDLGEKLEVTNLDAFKTVEELGGYEADAPKDQSIVYIQI